MDTRRLILSAPFTSKRIVSHGLIVFARDTKRFMITQRKHSIEFLLYLKGMYRVTHLPFLLCNLTQEEGSRVKDCFRTPGTFGRLYSSLGLDQKSYSYAFKRFQETRGVALELLENLDLSQNELQWTWPKGRQDSSDFSSLDCAKREFLEEVEIDLPEALFVSDNFLIDSVKTITRRTVEARYWIYVIPYEVPVKAPREHPEVATRLWGTADFCRSVVTNKHLFELAERSVQKI